MLIFPKLRLFSGFIIIKIMHYYLPIDFVSMGFRDKSAAMPLQEPLLDGGVTNNVCGNRSRMAALQIICYLALPLTADR